MHTFLHSILLFLCHEVCHCWGAYLSRFMKRGLHSFYSFYIFDFNDLYSFVGSFKLFQDTRQQIAKLSGVHSLLKRLQFLFKLPGKLKVTLQEGNYAQVCIWNVECLWWISKTLQNIPNTNHHLFVTAYSGTLSAVFVAYLLSYPFVPLAPSNFWTNWQMFWNVGVNKFYSCV